MLKRYFAFLVIYIFSTLAFATKPPQPPTSTITSSAYRLVDGLSGQPIAGITVQVCFVTTKHSNNLTTNVRTVMQIDQRWVSGTTDNTGYLAPLTYTYYNRDPVTGYYGGDCNPSCDKYFYDWDNGDVSGIRIASPGFSNVTYVSSNGYILVYSAILTTPANNNSISLTQNGINKLLVGLFQNNDSRFPHGFSGSLNGNTYALNFGAPQLTILDGARVAITIPFSGSAMIPVYPGAGYYVNANVAGSISFSAALVSANINGGYQMQVQIPVSDNSYSWIVLTSCSIGSVAFYQPIFRSTWGATLSGKIGGPGFGGYINLGNPIVSGTIGGIYSEMGLQTPTVFTTQPNSSSPGLSTATFYFYDRLSFIGSLQ